MHPLLANRQILLSCLAELLGLARQFGHDKIAQEAYALEAARITLRLKEVQGEIERQHLD